MRYEANRRSLENPCITCGACCAHYRASFHWSEADDAGGTVPVDLTVDISPFRRAMRGTEHSKPCCVALEGAVGIDVRCVIYEQRPSVCREFTFSWEDGENNEKCDKARLAIGLTALSPLRVAVAPELPNAVVPPPLPDLFGVPSTSASLVAESVSPVATEGPAAVQVVKAPTTDDV